MAEIHVIVPAAGMGTRMGPGRPKQFRELGGEPLLLHTVSSLLAWGKLDSLTIVAPADELDRVRESVLPRAGKLPLRVVAGGEDRQASVYEGLKQLKDVDEEAIVVIHDGVRPFVSPEVLSAAVDGAMRAGAATAGVAAKDTIKLVGTDGFVRHTPERARCYQIQTPQAFRLGVLRKAHHFAKSERPGERGTDDATLVERMGRPVEVTPGLYENIKITTPEDLEIAVLLARRFREREAGKQ